MTVTQPDEEATISAEQPSSEIRRRRPRRQWSFVQRYGVIGVWALLIVVFGALKPSEFLTTTNFETMFDSQGTLLLLALGFIVPLIAGEIDLSLAGSFTIEVVLIGRLDIVHHWGYAPVFLSIIGLGIVVGVLQGFLIVTLRLNSLIVTLGTGTAFLGIALGIDTTPRSGVGAGYAQLFSGSFLGLELSFWLALAAVLIGWYVFRYTPLGRRMFFVGANPNVARLSGIRVQRIKFSSLVVSSVVAALASIVAVGYLNGTDPTLGSDLLLPMLSSAFLGTTCFDVGRPSAWGTFVATYLLVTGYTGLEIIGLAGWIQDVFYGGALVIALAVSSLTVKGGAGNTIGLSVETQ
ncbi:MAG: ABC transporter permease [Actinomycetota bacterium]|nr:ABC transporter permease [Actinomycetota bacterium]MDA8359063.1 ABC transporter permease [Actinomycetota bacterium]